MKKELPPDPEALPRPVTDSHCHLDATTALSGLGLEDALSRAAAAGITRIVQVGCDVESSRFAVETAGTCDQVIATVAIHPNDAARLADDLPEAIEQIELLATAHDKVRGVGETGIDHFRTTDEHGRQLQRESFAAHIHIAQQHDKTLVIHDRDGHDEILEILDAEGCPERIVMHCFSGDADFARACLDRGAYLSFPGTVTFKPNEALREACRITPLDRILTETDAPYLTPMPYRGYPNASYLIPHTVRFMAELRGDDLAVLCDALHHNADAAFGAW
ncbi:TatD family hydrolase [Propionibacteriaceae bacterium Y1700]|uniref:TatD family hydrolase n=1 Tax=Microlunatus sp. Y1700 TaxID=3418487 RepID=UPI003DA7281D